MILFLLGFLWSADLYVSQPLFVVGDSTFNDSYFYEEIFKDDWVGLGAVKKRSVFDDFLEKELAFIQAKKIGLHLNPAIVPEISRKKNQLLINNTYEHLIARPLLTEELLLYNEENLLYKTEAYHLLVGYNGSVQETDSGVSKEVAFTLIDSLYHVIKREALSQRLDSVFIDYASNYSSDPSAKKNGGFLGWVPWGRTVMSFQQPLFDLPLNQLSKPIHTEYGFHLILKTGVAFSSFYYYSTPSYINLVHKVAQNSLPFDSLRSLSAVFDSTLLKKSGVFFNALAVDELVFLLEKKQKKERLMGNKYSLIEWFQEFDFSFVLFTYNNKGVGVGWLVNKLKTTPSSRIPPLKTKEDLEGLVLSFLLQEEVLSLAEKNNIKNTASFKIDWHKNYKNILYNEFVSSQINLASEVDSSVVVDLYNRGIYNKDFIKPKQVVFSEIRVFDALVASLLQEKIYTGVSFDVLLEKYGGSIKEPVSEGSTSAVGLTAFALRVGEISSLLKNNNGSFSFIRVEKFLEAYPFEIEKVFAQIERKIIKEGQEKIKKNLLLNLIKDLNVSVNYSVVGL